MDCQLDELLGRFRKRTHFLAGAWERTQLIHHFFSPLRFGTTILTSLLLQLFDSYESGRLLDLLLLIYSTDLSDLAPSYKRIGTIT